MINLHKCMYIKKFAVLYLTFETERIYFELFRYFYTVLIKWQGAWVSVCLFNLFFYYCQYVCDLNLMIVVCMSFHLSKYLAVRMYVCSFWHLAYIKAKLLYNLLFISVRQSVIPSVTLWGKWEFLSCYFSKTANFSNQYFHHYEAFSTSYMIYIFIYTDLIYF